MNKVSVSHTLPHKIYPSAQQGVSDSMHCVETAQTKAAAYRLAFADKGFLTQDELRGVRLQLEYEKAHLLQERQGIDSTIVMFGSARIPSPESAEVKMKEAQAALEQDPDNPELQRKLRIQENLAAKVRYYEEARELARIVSTTCQNSHQCDFVVSTGGGPGIMEAANRGAFESHAKNIGHNIVLPHEQAPNPYITPDLCFQFHYFAIRKMHFLMRAKALVCFPGGFGTLDELFEALTLIQTKKVEPIPVLLFGREWWTSLVNFDFLVEEGTISAEDLEIFQFVETAQEAWSHICSFYSLREGR